MPLVFERKQGDLPVFKHAMEEVVCYKLFQQKKSGVASLFHKDHLLTHLTMKSHIGPLSMVPIMKSKKVFYITSEGLYSYKYLKDAKKMQEVYTGSKQFKDADIVLRKVIIPVGSLYVEKGYQLMSNRLLLKEEI